MVSFKTLAAVVLPSATAATPAFAQAAIQEPGAYAFYHPNADVLAGRGGYRAPDANAFYGANAYYDQVAPAPQIRHHRAVRKAR